MGRTCNGRVRQGDLGSSPFLVPRPHHHPVHPLHGRGGAVGGPHRHHLAGPALLLRVPPLPQGQAGHWLPPHPGEAGAEWDRRQHRHCPWCHQKGGSLHPGDHPPKGSQCLRPGYWGALGARSCCGVPGSSHPFLQDGSDSEHSSDTGLGSERGSDASTVGEGLVPSQCHPQLLPIHPWSARGAGGAQPCLRLLASLHWRGRRGSPSSPTFPMDPQAGMPGTWSCGQLCQPAAPAPGFQPSPSPQMWPSCRH